jgi:hypothetical protein
MSVGVMKDYKLRDLQWISVNVSFFLIFWFRFRRHVGTVFKTLYPKVPENEIEKVISKDTFPAILIQ